MIEINLWAEKYFPLPVNIVATLHEVKQNKEAFIKTKTSELES